MTAFDFSPSRLPIRRSALVAGVAALAAVIAVPSLLDNRTGHHVSASTTTDVVDRTAPAATTSVVPPAAQPAAPVAAIATATATPATASVTNTAPAELAKPPAPPAATAACHNSTDPSCGAFSWSPAPAANQPMSIAVAVSPALPKAGELVTVTVTATDPDALVTTNGGSYFFADPNSTEPQVGFAATFDSGTPRYGQWTPPAAQPGHLQLSFTHTFSQAGTFDFTFAALSGDEAAPGDVQRNPYASSASTKIPITVAPAAA